MKPMYKKGSLSLTGTVAMGTGVMIGAGIFALTGQVAQYAGRWFPLAFLIAAVVSSLSAYSYIKVCKKYPSAGGIAMILSKAYGPTAVTGTAAVLMALSMVINESLVARTFGTYVMQLFDIDNAEQYVPALAIALIVVAFLINIAGNSVISRISKLTAAIKIGGILTFALIVLWTSGFSFAAGTDPADATRSGTGFLAGTALAILAYKGFTTITNTGDEVKDPQKNVGRAIMISLGICVVVYMLVALGVGATLSIDEIVAAKDYSLAQAARPTMGDYGLWFTVAIAIVATASGLLASIFAVSRMLAMLTDMRLIPHRHFGMAGDIQRHTLVYTVVLAGLLAGFFDLSRIASLGAIFYLVMDMVVHWGVLRYLRQDVGASPVFLISAIAVDALVLAAFIGLKMQSDALIVVIAIVSIAFVAVFEKLYIGRVDATHSHDHH